ncbi:Ger(x)C family spore germination protein [Peribacillus muralis]|uniref:Ger(x)C family spore germination protein n=1 Tax=Peribacillus muralis TaxID=264697 RepID=UPI0036701311
MKQNKIRYIRIIIITSLFLSITGCGNYTEVNELAIITGIGIDKPKAKQDIYRVTFQVTRPGQTSNPSTGGGGEGIPVVNYTDEGHTITEAARKISKQLSRENFYGHNAILVIDENTAKDNILKVLDAFDRDPFVPSRVPIVLAHRTSAQSILKVLTPLDTIPSISLVSQVQHTHDARGESELVPINKVDQYVTRRGADLSLVGISFKGKAKHGAKKANIDQTQPTTVPIIDGMGIFRHGKLVHWMKNEKARSLFISYNALKETDVNIACGKDRYFTTVIRKSKAKKHAEMRDGNLHFKMNVKMKGTLEETTCDWDIANPDTISKMELKLEEKIQEELIQSIKESLSHKSDPFHIGETLFRQHPEQWKEVEADWGKQRKILAQAQGDVKVNVEIMRTGMRTNRAKESK